jgi:hypothetical protein
MAQRISHSVKSIAGSAKGSQTLDKDSISWTRTLLPDISVF